MSLPLLLPRLLLLLSKRRTLQNRLSSSLSESSNALSQRSEQYYRSTNRNDRNNTIAALTATIGTILIRERVIANPTMIDMCSRLNVSNSVDDVFDPALYSEQNGTMPYGATKAGCGRYEIIGFMQIVPNEWSITNFISSDSAFDDIDY